MRRAAATGCCVNRQPLKRARDLLGVLRVTRVRARRPRAREGRARPSAGATSTTPWWPSHPRYDALRGEVDKVLKQRNALLKGAGGRLDESAAFTLDVWDAKLAESGGALAAARRDLLDRLAPVLSADLRRGGPRPGRGHGRATSAEWAADGLAAALGGGPAGRRAPRRVHGRARTATTSTCASAACPPAPTPRRASSGRWPSRCGWPPTT